MVAGGVLFSTYLIFLEPFVIGDTVEQPATFTARWSGCLADAQIRRGYTPPLEATKMHARVGKEAIDFEATAFIEGVGFQPVKLSDYKGKWIVLCFYPGDFTFV